MRSSAFETGLFLVYERTRINLRICELFVLQSRLNNGGSFVGKKVTQLIFLGISGAKFPI